MTRERWTLSLAGLLWAGSVAFGMKVISDYRAAPGRGADPSDWPAATALRRTGGGDTLVMLAHPQCPCTRASLSELNLIMNRLRGRLTATVVFVRPKEFAPGWEKTESWERAQSIPGVTVLTDVDGVEAARFHAYTSGQTFLYDAAGRLLYAGGITAGRGHEGDNDGLRAVVSAVETGKAGRRAAKVFGCALFSSSTMESKGGRS